MTTTEDFPPIGSDIREVSAFLRAQGVCRSATNGELAVAGAVMELHNRLLALERRLDAEAKDTEDMNCNRGDNQSDDCASSPGEDGIVDLGKSKMAAEAIVDMARENASKYFSRGDYEQSMLWKVLLDLSSAVAEMQAKDNTAKPDFCPSDAARIAREVGDGVTDIEAEAIKIAGFSKEDRIGNIQLLRMIENGLLRGIALERERQAKAANPPHYHWRASDGSLWREDVRKSQVLSKHVISVQMELVQEPPHAAE